VATGAEIVQEVSAPMRIWELSFDHGSVPQQKMLDAVIRHPNVMMAQNDHPVTFRAVPNDPSYSQQWQHQNIDSELAWNVTTGGLTADGDEIVVCVIDPAAPGGVRMQSAVFRPQQGDTLVVVNGARQPLGTALPGVPVARDAPWYVRGEPLAFTVGTQRVEYLTYQTPRQIEPHLLTYIGRVNGNLRLL
jgi:hypothetical protein